MKKQVAFNTNALKGMLVEDLSLTDLQISGGNKKAGLLELA